MLFVATSLHLSSGVLLMLELNLFRSPARSCYNCRRRRWRCDRSIPVCQKCSASGEECLGYNAVTLRWANGPALRGNLATRTNKHRDSASPLGPAERKLSDGTRATIIAPSLDPVLAHLDRASRYYLHHCETPGKTSDETTTSC